MEKETHCSHYFVPLPLLQPNLTLQIRKAAQDTCDLSYLRQRLQLIAAHTVRFYLKYVHFYPAFRDEIDESFFRFFIQTEKCSQARYARTIKKNDNISAKI